MNLVIDKDYASRILGKIAFACFIGLLAGCASKPVPTTQPKSKSAIGQRIEEIKTSRAEAQSLLVYPNATSTNRPGIQRTNISLAWDNPNPLSESKYMLTEFHSATNAIGPFKFKAYVAAGITNVTFKITNAAEFFICRFAQTNITPWLVSDWNTK